MKSRLISLFMLSALLLVLLPTIPASPVQAQGGGWELAETKIDPPGGAREYSDRDGSVTGKINVSETSITRTNSQDITSWSTGERINWAVTSTFTYKFDKPLDALTQGEVVTVTVTGKVTGSGSMSKAADVYRHETLTLRSVWTDKSSTSEQMRGLWQGAGTTEIAQTLKVSYGDEPVTQSFSLMIPEAASPDDSVRLFVGVGNVPSGSISWTFRAAKQASLSIKHFPAFEYFQPGTGQNISPAGDLVATLKDEDGKPMKDELLIFYVDPETPAPGEPGKNLQKVIRTVPMPMTIKNEVPGRKYLAGIRTNTSGEARINYLQEFMPRDFTTELIGQRATFVEEETGKISGNIMVGVYNQETQTLELVTPITVEYNAIAKILSITGEGRSDDYKQAFMKEYPDSPEWGSGPVRVARPWALPHFEYQAVSEGFLLMPGDIVEIDSGVTVEIAWITGDKVTAYVPEKSEALTSTEYHQRARLQMLGSAYNSGFMTTPEKISDIVFGFGCKKGAAFLIQSIPIVGPILKEGRELVIEIYTGVQDTDFSKTDIITRCRIRSDVIIDNTGDDLKVYNLEGSPDIQTAAGGEVTLAEGHMVTVSDTGVISKAKAFDQKEVDKEYGDIVPDISRKNSSVPAKSNNATGSGMPAGVIIGIIAVVVVALAFFVLRKRVRKA